VLEARRYWKVRTMISSRGIPSLESKVGVLEHGVFVDLILKWAVLWHAGEVNPISLDMEKKNLSLKFLSPQQHVCEVGLLDCHRRHLALLYPHCLWVYLYLALAKAVLR
jgi:hypothetical protein